jgi:hypothetical protein
MGSDLGHHDHVLTGAHASGVCELTHANEGVEIKLRRQHLHTVVVTIRDEHEVVR